MKAATDTARPSMPARIHARFMSLLAEQALLKGICVQEKKMTVIIKAVISFSSPIAREKLWRHCDAFDGRSTLFVTKRKRRGQLPNDCRSDERGERERRSGVMPGQNFPQDALQART